MGIVIGRIVPTIEMVKIPRASEATTSTTADPLAEIGVAMLKGVEMKGTVMEIGTKIGDVKETNTK